MSRRRLWLHQASVSRSPRLPRTHAAPGSPKQEKKRKKDRKEKKRKVDASDEDPIVDKRSPDTDDLDECGAPAVAAI